MKKILFLILIFIPSIVFAENNFNISEYYTKIEIYNNKIKYQDAISVKTNEYNVEIKKYLPNNIKIETNLKNINLEENYLIINNGQNLDYKYYINYYEPTQQTNKELEIVIGNNFNASINTTSFEITLPKTLKNYKIEYYLNDTKLDETNLNIHTEANKIIGSYDKTLEENNKLYIKVNLTSSRNSTLKFLNIIIPICFLIISYVIWFIFGKDHQIKNKKNHYPPKTLTALEISLIYNGTAKPEDIIYSIIELANEGYIKIVEVNNNYELIRVKDYNGRNNKESLLYKSIFQENSSITLTEYLEIISSKNPKYNLLDKITIKELIKKINKINTANLNIINNPKEKNKYFEQSADNKKIYLILMVAIILLLNSCTPFYELNYLYYIPISLILSIFTLFQIIKFLEALYKQKTTIKNVVVNSLIFIIVWIIFLIPIFQIDQSYMITYSVGIICSTLILILYYFMPKRTLYGSKQLSIIEGFKNYIIKCSNQELEQDILNNPNYIYDILPVSYITGINDILTKKINKIKISNPDWFEVNNFSINKLNKFVKQFNNSLKNK